MPVNSRQKGKRGERAAVEFLKGQGFLDARRSQQFNGIGLSDVICPDSLPGVAIEVKYGYPLSQFDIGSKLWDQACRQARDDSADGITWAILWKPRGHRSWRVSVLDRQGYGVATYPGRSAYDVLRRLRA